MFTVTAALTAAQLLSFCTESSDVSAANCSSYIVGVAEADLRSVCLPENSVYAQLVTEFVTKAKAEAPAVLIQMPAAAYLRAQWAENHPCP